MAGDRRRNGCAVKATRAQRSNYLGLMGLRHLEDGDGFA